MNRNRIIVLLAVISFSFLLAGCPEEAVKEEAAAVKEAAAEKMKEKAIGLDTDVLPRPRPALDSTPDLSGARLVINSATLDKMAADGVPVDVVEALRGMDGQEFSNASAFIDAVNNAAGDNAKDFLNQIMRNALIIDLAASASAPAGQMSLAEAERRSQEAAGTTPQPAASMGSPEFEVIYFDFDKSNIKPEFNSSITANAQFLLDNPNISVTVEGHADERGTNEYNLALGERRAQAVRRALIEQGIPGNQMQTVSFGEERAVDLGHDEGAWAKNRRSVISIN